MAISEFFSSVTKTGSGTSLTQNITTSSSTNGILMVLISAYRSAGGIDVASVSFNAEYAVEAESASYSGNTHRSWIYYFLDPGANTDDLIATFDASADWAAMTIIGYEGVDQTTPFDDTSAISGTCGTTCDLTLSPTDSTNVVLGSLFHNYNGTPTASYGYMTTEGQASSANGSHSVSSSTGQASQTDLRWNAGTVDGFAFTGVALKEGTDITSGLQLHLEFEDGSGPTATDSTANSNDCNLSGSYAWTTGQVGSGGIQLDYTDGEDYGEIPNSASLENVQEGDYTLSAWFKPGSTPPGTGSDNDAHYGILLKTGWHLGLYYGNDNKFHCVHILTGDQSVGATSTNTFSPGSWYHITGVVDKSAGTVKLYVDGTLEDTGNFTGGTAAREYNTTTWKVGVANPGGPTYAWPADGIIDEVRIYNRTLSDADVTALAAHGGPFGPPENSIVYVRTAGALGANFNMDIGTAGTNRLVTVHIGCEAATLIAVTAVTVDGKSCTLVHDIVNTIGAGNGQQMWYIDEDGLGASSGSVTVAFTGTITGCRTQAMLHTGVATGGPHDSGYDNTSGAVGTVTVTGIDCPANGVVIGGWGQGEFAPDTITSITSPHLQRFVEAPNSATLAGSSGIEASGATNKTYVLDWNTADGFRHTGIVASWAEFVAPTRTHQMML